MSRNITGITIIAFCFGALGHVHATTFVPYGGDTAWDESGRFCLVIDRAEGRRFERSHGPVVARFYEMSLPVPTYLRGRCIRHDVVELEGSNQHPEGIKIVTGDPSHIEHAVKKGEISFERTPDAVSIASRVDFDQRGPTVVFVFSPTRKQADAVVVCRTDAVVVFKCPVTQLFSRHEIEEMALDETLVDWMPRYPALLAAGKTLILFCATRESGPFSRDFALPISDCTVTISVETGRVNREGTAASIRRCFRSGSRDSKIMCMQFCETYAMTELIADIEKLEHDPDVTVKIIAENVLHTMKEKRDSPADPLLPGVNRVP